MKKITLFSRGLLISILFLCSNHSAFALDNIISDLSIPQVTGVEAVTTIPFDPEYMIANQLIVEMEKGQKLKTDYPQEKLLISKYTKHNYVFVQINDQADSDAVITKLLKLPGVISIEYNGIYELDTATPNDEYYTKDPSKYTYGWQHYSDYEYGGEEGVATSNNEAWDHQTGSAEIIIAIIDTGIDTDHPDLQGNIWVNPDEIAGNGIDDDTNGFIDDINGWDFANDEADPNPNLDGIDDDGDGTADDNAPHGTGVHGAVAPVGNNSIGVAGSMWDASIMALQTNINGDYGINTAAAVDAIYYAIDNGADIINMSFGSTKENTSLTSAVNAAADAGIFLVASAGNDPETDLNETPRYPVCNDRVFGVSGYSLSAQAASETYGSNCVDLVAPYDHFKTTSIDAATGQPSYINSYGTSYSAPLVAGIAGLMLSEKNTLTRQEITNILIATVTKMDSIPSEYGAGLVNGGAALAGVNCLNSDGSVKTVITYYVDSDGDGYGMDDIEYSCSTSAPMNTSTTKTDCNDADKSVYSNQTYYKDADGDGYGSTTKTTTCSSTAPTGYVTNSSDCNDSNKSVHSNQTYYKDADADGLGDPNNSTAVCSSTAPSGYVSNANDKNDSDYDNDSVSSSNDCDDKDSSISTKVTYYQDNDVDGKGNSSVTSTICSNVTPANYSKMGGDCNDADNTISSNQTYYQDTDGDGLGNVSSAAAVCSNTAPAGYVSNASDNNDSDYDNDGTSNNSDCHDKDSAISTHKTYYQDADGDGLGNATVTTLVCAATAPTGYVTNSIDSNDNDFDNDGTVTEDDCNDRDDSIDQEQTYYKDTDGDGLGDPENPTAVCATVAPVGYVDNSNDNNDAQYSLYSDNDPADPAVYQESVKEIQGAKNGKIKVIFKDNSEFNYMIFDVETDTKTKVLSYNNTGYLLVLHPQGKTLALVNVYTGDIYEKEKLGDKKFKINSLKIFDLRSDDITEVIVTSKKDVTVRTAILKVKPTKDNKIKLTDTLSLDNDAITPKTTKPQAQQIELSNDAKAVVEVLTVSSEYELAL